MKLKRSLTILLSLCMVFLILPVLSAKPKALNDSPTPKHLIVNGIDIQTRTDHTVKCGNGTAVYSPADRVLTLDHASITATDWGKNGIYSDGDFTIRLIGNNTIAGENMAVGLYGAYDVDIRIIGSGSLETVGSKYGIYCFEGSLFIAGKVIASSLDENSTAIAITHALWDDVNPLTLGAGMHYPGNLYFRQCSGYYEILVFTQNSIGAFYLENDKYDKAEKSVTISSDLVYKGEKPAAIPEGIVGQPIIPIEITGFSGGTAPYEYSASGLPRGLLISNTGKIYGTPVEATAAGTAAITYTDANGISTAIDVPYSRIIAVNQTSLGLSVKASADSTGKVTAVITKEEISSALAHTSPDIRFTMSLDIDAPSDTESVAVTIPAAEIKAIGVNTDLYVNTPIGDILLDSDALNSVVQKVGDNDFQVIIKVISRMELNERQNATLSGYPGASVYELSVLSNNSSLDIRAGSMILRVSYPFTNYQSAAGLSVLTIDTSGAVDKQNAVYDYNDASVHFPVLPNLAYMISYNDSTGYKNPYNDISASEWYCEPVKYVTINKLMNGTSADAFSPDTAITRGMIVTVLYRLEGKPFEPETGDFKDVKENTYYFDAVKWASAHEIVIGYGYSYDSVNGYGNKFGPFDTLTREQMVTILYRYAQYKGYDTSSAANLDGFSDTLAIHSYAVEGIQWAFAEKLINGVGPHTIAPQESAQRSQVAAILQRLTTNIAK